jgi:tol-pal system protein YbgF
MKMGGVAFRHAGLTAVAAICLSIGSLAHAGIFDDEEARRAILEMRQKIDGNRALVDKMAEEQRRASDASARSFLSLQNQIDALKSDLATSRGQNEQLTRDVSDLQKQQKSISQNVEQRLREVEPAKVSMDGADFSVAPAEQQDFDAALAMFKQGNFAGAQSAFSGLLNKYPNTGYAPSAYFWLGNSQYANKSYKDAISSFRSLIAKAPQSTRAPEAALSIANCQSELKDVKGARKTLEDLVQAYPQSEAASAAKERLSKAR